MNKKEIEQALNYLDNLEIDRQFGITDIKEIAKLNGIINTCTEALKFVRELYKG